MSQTTQTTIQQAIIKELQNLADEQDRLATHRNIGRTAHDHPIRYAENLLRGRAERLKKELN